MLIPGVCVCGRFELVGLLLICVWLVMGYLLLGFGLGICVLLVNDAFGLCGLDLLGILVWFAYCD